MKPPPRTRNKPDRNLTSQPATQTARKRTCSWSRKEQMMLLDALKKLRKDGAALINMDFSVLNKAVPSRSVSEIQSVVECLQNKVISNASLQMKMSMLAEKKAEAPIEMWTRLAFAVSGSHNEPISSAFSQMLTVASTEPRSLQNCDPPQLHTAVHSDHLVGRTVPLRPLPAPVRAQAKTPAATVAAAKRLEQIPPIATTSSCQPTVIQEPSPTHTADPHPATSPASVASPTPSQAGSPVSASSTCPSTSASLSPHTSAAVVNTGSHTAKTSPRVLGVKCVVDFERIYNYLSSVHKPDNKYELTAMESAIVLDLLMSLPEELLHLDCKRLHRHFIQVYQTLSQPADSEKAKEILQEQKTGLQESEQPEPQQEHSGTSSPNELSGSSGQMKDPKQMGRCPPLNPFMVPLELLKHM
ncbi:snRNA-activating protein complex subunit 2 [Dunckerocampus dactyliophorus]|uniref:snRNA-activating protein complex subunit 2 n=1 Tax=Dunckerocampus dactyliophorus TaxID=161453 RepID=UPI0024073967|nr:snRNA-activating protein complex subunit 2 [Dunckerocampus dactyliophorus]